MDRSGGGGEAALQTSLLVIAYGVQPVVVLMHWLKVVAGLVAVQPFASVTRTTSEWQPVSSAPLVTVGW